MAKKIVRYLLEGNGSTPVFISDGGHFAINEEFIGVSVDESLRHVPSTVYRLTKAQLLTWITQHHQTNSVFVYDIITNMQYTEQDMVDITDAFLQKVGLPDYA